MGPETCNPDVEISGLAELLIASNMKTEKAMHIKWRGVVECLSLLLA